MTDRLTFYLGPDAERVWAEYLRQVEADAEALRHREEANDE